MPSLLRAAFAERAGGRGRVLSPDPLGPWPHVTQRCPVYGRLSRPCASPTVFLPFWSRVAIEATHHISVRAQGRGEPWRHAPKHAHSSSAAPVRAPLLYSNPLEAWTKLTTTVQRRTQGAWVVVPVCVRQFRPVQSKVTAGQACQAHAGTLRHPHPHLQSATTCKRLAHTRAARRPRAPTGEPERASQRERERESPEPYCRPTERESTQSP